MANVALFSLMEQKLWVPGFAEATYAAMPRGHDEIHLCSLCLLCSHKELGAKKWQCIAHFLLCSFSWAYY